MKTSFPSNDAIFQGRVCTVQPAWHVCQTSVMRNALVQHFGVRTELKSVPTRCECIVGVVSSTVGLLTIGLAKQAVGFTLCWG